nr:reverse transcriptase [Tanacetum cinerariifolium]
MVFGDVWCNWIHACLTTYELEFMVNGDSVAVIKPKRGLRQGDPISPYLFIIVADVLSRQISKALTLGTLSGIKMARTCPLISHIFFADDSLFFLKASHGECGVLVPFNSDFFIHSPRGPFDNRIKVIDFIQDGKWNIRMLFVLKRLNIYSLDVLGLAPFGLTLLCASDLIRQDSKAAFGIVVRDSTGCLRYALGNCCHAISHTHAEIIVVHSPCSLAFNRGWVNVIVESDSQVTICLSYLKSSPPWSLATLDSKAAFGIVVRDSTGCLRYVLGNCCHAISHTYVEIIVVHSACSLVFNRGWLNAIVESDSQVAISLSFLKSPPPWSLATLVDDIRFWSKSMQLSFSWVNRERNQVANWVAHYAFSNTLEFSWDATFPEELTSLSRSDMY